MDSSEFSYLNIEFIFLGDRPDAAEVVRTALADRRLLGFVGGSVERELSTEVSAQVATVSPARDAVLYRVDAKGKLREGSRVTKLVHELKNSTQADFVLLDGEEIDGPTPDEDVLGDYGPTTELIHGRKLKGSEVVVAAGLENNVLTLWNHGTGLMAMAAESVFTSGIARSNRPFVSLTRNGNTLSALVTGTGTRREFFPRTVRYYVDLERSVIIEPEADSPAAERLTELDASLLGWDEQDDATLAEFITDPVKLDEARQLVKSAGSLKNLKRFVTLLGFDARSVDYLTGKPLPENIRVIATGGPVKTIKAALAEHEREARGLEKLLYRGGWSPRALIASSLAVLGSGALTHLALNKCNRLSGIPKPLRNLLMIAWYADGVYYLGKGILGAVKARGK
ncbi:hypothetical protein [Glutamicibacter sp. NPDC087344]|uniref:hypothetical protein n=1 Tax=Glutamicibacter sp. NPDC087344 TaxID=3363994 RepID=UPI00380A6C0F